jgi:hypothetical protein
VPVDNVDNVYKLWYNVGKRRGEMTIDEAIKWQKQVIEGVPPSNRTIIHEAMQLGIEALRLVKAQRGHRWVDAPKPLPGETVPTAKERYAEAAGLPPPLPGETEE